MGARTAAPDGGPELTLAARIRGGLLGALVGDALGVPYEFHPPRALPPPEQLAMDASRWVGQSGQLVRRAHASVPPGTWSDDGAQALCLLASLLDCGRLDPADLARRLLRWADEGYLAVDGSVFDIGLQTTRALNRVRAGQPAERCGPAEERDNGNGSLMRVLPLALWHTGPDDALVEDALRQSRITHGHPRSTVACALTCLWARGLLAGLPDPWPRALATARALLDGPERAEVERLAGPFTPGGTGYVLDTFAGARALLAGGAPYAQVVRQAIALGHDTDTTACVAGGLAGVRDGEGAIPADWLQALRGRELLDPLLDALVQHRQAG